MDDATIALTQLAAEQLEKIALDLDAILQSGGTVVNTRELAARYRVFAGVLQATSENVRVLVRVAGHETAGMSWAR